MRLPEPRGSRAVLIGTSAYDSGDLRPLLAVRNNLGVLRDILTADQTGGFLPSRCDVVQDASDPREVCRTLREAAADAPDTLLVYFCGHGILNADLTELHLALTGTDQNDLRWTSIPFQAVREILEEASCRNKILILDCCHSGWVLDELMSGGHDTAKIVLDIRGVHMLASASRDEASIAPPGERYTAFTGELIRLLRDGIPGAADPLSLTTLYKPLAQALKERGYPRPKQQGSGDYGELGIVRNRAEPDAQAFVPSSTERDEGRRQSETHFTTNNWFARLRLLLLLLPTEALMVLLVLYSLEGTGGQQFDSRSLQGLARIVGVGGAVFLLWWAAALSPTDYSMVVNPDGIELRSRKSRHFYYPWHAISRVWIRPRKRRLRRRPRYELMLRLKPGVFVSETGFATAGPRNDRRADALRFADLRRVKATPEEVEVALAESADSAWTPCPGLEPLPRKPSLSPVTFTGSRSIMLGVAVGSGFGAFVIFPRDILLTGLWDHLTTLTLCAALGWVCAFSGMRVRHPARLTVDGAGVEFSYRETELAYSWSEISRIGVVPWPPGVKGSGVLAVRPAAPATAPVDRTNRLLPHLTAGTVTVCPLYEITADRADVEAALSRFGESGQIAKDGGSWLRTSLSETGRTFRGRLPLGWVAVAVGLLSLPLLVTGGFSEPAAALIFLNDAVFPPLVFVGVPLYFLKGADRVLLRIAPSGFDVRFLRHRVHVPWGDVERIGLVVRREPLDESVMVWLRPGAKIPKSRWSCLIRKHGGLRVLSLQECRIDGTAADLDQCIARYAGRKHSRIMYIRDGEPENGANSRAKQP